MSYPNYSRAERIADGAVHVLGVTLALIGVALLFRVTPGPLDPAAWVALAVYAVALVAMLSASAAYHLAAYTPARPWLRRLDHAAIYLKIAGTYTPLAVLVGSAFGYALLALVWALALFGAMLKLLAAPGRMTTGWLPYVALGWLGILLIVPLTGVMPLLSLILICAGGALYTLGVPFYCWEKLKFANAIWHGFVLAATGCFFGGIASAMAAIPH